MDTPSHVLLGAVTAQLGFRQRIGRDATWVAAATSLLPDLDTLAVPLMSLTSTEVDDLARITVHRGLSHSLLVAPLLALPIAAVWWWLRRRWANSRRPADDNSNAGRPARSAAPFGWMYLCVLVAALVHPLLDWCTSYGTQLLAPITNARFSLDAIPIVDIFLTPLLIVTLLVGFIVRKASRGGARKATLAVAWAGFALFVGYIGAGRVMRGVAIRRALAVAGEGRIVRADAYPTIGSILLWRAVIRTDRGWQVSRQHMLSDRPGRPNFAPQVSNEYVARAEQLEAGRTFRWFAQGRIRTAYDRRDGLHVVELHDMRYGPSPGAVDSLWRLRVTFAGEDDPSPHTEMVTGFRRGSFRETAARFWRDMWEY